jgi:hypothetical protein
MNMDCLRRRRETTFEHPTVAEFARFVEQGRAGSAAVDTPIPRVERGRPLPLSFARQHMWFLHQHEHDNPSSYLALAFRLLGKLRLPALARALHEVGRRHETLRTTCRLGIRVELHRLSPIDFEVGFAEFDVQTCPAEFAIYDGYDCGIAVSPKEGQTIARNTGFTLRKHAGVRGRFRHRSRTRKAGSGSIER